MADFSIAYKKTIKHEGGYANNPLDKGGETYKGIARNYHPSWQGWKYIDSIANKKQGAIFANIALDAAIFEFYLKYFWDKNQLGSVNSQAVADSIFDWAVNSGGAIKEIQRLLNITADGIVGKQTITAINLQPAKNLLSWIYSARKKYYEKGVDNGWFSSVFLDGLLKRAEQYNPNKKKL